MGSPSGQRAEEMEEAGEKSLEIILETLHWSLNAGGDEKKKRKAGVFDESS